jgi:DNA-directed RNA polymerase alpha subunit
VGESGMDYIPIENITRNEFRKLRNVGKKTYDEFFQKIADINEGD